MRKLSDKIINWLAKYNLWIGGEGLEGIAHLWSLITSCIIILVSSFIVNQEYIYSVGIIYILVCILFPIISRIRIMFNKSPLSENMWYSIVMGSVIGSIISGIIYWIIKMI